ncbi:MAG: hypothetical protein HYX38_21140 [Rhodospirillales bacterium]|nr:hypothetical protein [Rhodospirillales bacterium]
MTNDPDKLAKEARYCHDAARRARRLAHAVGNDADRDTLLQFAAEQDQRAAQLEAANGPPPARVTLEQQQVQQQANAEPEGPRKRT